MTRMPSEVDFDDFCDNLDSGETYFKDLPEPDEARHLRLHNMNAYNKLEPAMDFSPRTETFVRTQNVPARPKGTLGLQPPLRKRLPDRMSSIDSLSSLSDFGTPSVQQVPPSRQKIAAAAARVEPQISLQQALSEISASQHQQISSTALNGSQAPTPTQKKQPHAIHIPLRRPLQTSSIQIPRQHPRIRHLLPARDPRLALPAPLRPLPPRILLVAEVHAVATAVRRCQAGHRVSGTRRRAASGAGWPRAKPSFVQGLLGSCAGSAPAATVAGKCCEGG